MPDNMISVSRAALRIYLRLAYSNGFAAGAQWVPDGYLGEGQFQADQWMAKYAEEAIASMQQSDDD